MGPRSLLSRLLRGPAHDITSPLARLERKLEEQNSAIRLLTVTIRKQAQQIKELRRLQEQTQANSASVIERLGATHARQLDEQRRVQSENNRQALEAHARTQKLEMRWRTTFSWQICAVLRKLYLPVTELPFPSRLAAHRFKLRSQHEEDGYLLALLQEAGTTDRRFVEIGCGRSGGNAALLAFECGWGGLMIDSNPEAIDYVDRIYAFNTNVTAVLAEVTPANVNELLTANGVTGEVDLLSIDIDSYDYWVFESLQVCSPRLLILEYNAGFGRSRAVTIPKDQPIAGTPKGYSGASLAALTKLAARKGYRLAACEYSGANAFYLRDDVAPGVPAQPPERAYRPAMSRVEVDQERPLQPEELYRLFAERGLPLVEV